MNSWKKSSGSSKGRAPCWIPGMRMSFFVITAAKSQLWERMGGLSRPSFCRSGTGLSTASRAEVIKAKIIRAAANHLVFMTCLLHWLHVQIVRFLIARNSSLYLAERKKREEVLSRPVDFSLFFPAHPLSTVCSGIMKRSERSGRERRLFKHGPQKKKRGSACLLTVAG